MVSWKNRKTRKVIRLGGWLWLLGCLMLAGYWWMQPDAKTAAGGEMLRPETWLLAQIGFVVEDHRPRLPELTEEFLAEAASGDHAEAAAEVSAAAPLVPSSPLRTIYREIGWTAALLNQSGIEVRGLTIELDLPEMGAVGTAVITDVGPCPAIQAADVTGGQVVTATFQHPASEQVLDVSFAGSVEPIGVTANHLFYSADRQEFVPIGQLAIGDRVQTFQGETRRITQKLPRPGPETVYNLEVYGEHVYFVGSDGILVHNSYERTGYGAFGWGRAPTRSVANRNLTKAEWQALYREQRLQR